MTVRSILALIAVISAMIFGAWTHGNPSGGGNFLTDNPGTNILTGSSGADLLLAQ